MPYLKNVPICIDYKYDFNKKRWYCNHLRLLMNSRVDCQHCIYCKEKKEN